MCARACRAEMSRARKPVAQGFSMGRHRKRETRIGPERSSMRQSKHALRYLVLATFIASFFCAQTASQAQQRVSPPGRLLASNCFQCHGPSEASPGFEKLTGKSTNKLLKEMRGYRSGAEGEGIMARHALGYTDQQLRDLVQWLSSQK